MLIAFVMIRVKGAKEIKPKFLPTAIMFEGLKPIIKEMNKLISFVQRCFLNFIQRFFSVYSRYIFIEKLIIGK